MDECDQKFVSSIGKKVYYKWAKNGYVYTLTYTSKGTEYWLCNSDNCVARLVKKEEIVKLGRKGWDVATQQHSTHAPDSNKVLAELALGTAKKLALEDPFAKTAEIWDKATQDVSLDAQPILPTEKNFKDYIRKYKKTNYQFKDPKILVDLIIPQTYQFTLRGDKFLQFDSADMNRTMIFTTENNLKILSQCETWILDGTFKSCPKLYRSKGQVYTIHGIFIRRNELGQLLSYASLPLVYALLRDKSRRTYHELFNAVKDIATKVIKLI